MLLNSKPRILSRISRSANNHTVPADFFQGPGAIDQNAVIDVSIVRGNLQLPFQYQCRAMEFMFKKVVDLRRYRGWQSISFVFQDNEAKALGGRRLLARSDATRHEYSAARFFGL